MPGWRETLDNPVFIKELRVGFREKKIFVALILWVLVIAFFASIGASVGLADNNSVSELPEAGKVLFETLFWAQLMLLFLLSPALTTSAVSGERERQSFEMLLTTHLTPAQLIAGKFGFASSFLVLALFATFPLEAMVFFLGGVSLTSFLTSKLTLLLFGLLASLVGLMLSARETRSAYATGQTYLVLFFFFPLLSGLSVLRYAPDIPGAAIALSTVLVLYLLLFLYWKAVNHLEERAAHLKALLRCGLVAYPLIVAICLSEPRFWGNLDDSMWLFYAPAHYVLLGIMLNPIRPARQRERQRFAESLLSRPAFWVALLSIGLLLPTLYAKDDAAVIMPIYTLIAGLGTALCARRLVRNKPSLYPTVLGSAWAVLNLIPILFALAGDPDGNLETQPATVSPLFYLIAAYNRSHNELPLIGLALYGVLLVLGLVGNLSASRTKSGQD